MHTTGEDKSASTANGERTHNKRWEEDFRGHKQSFYGGKGALGEASRAWNDMWSRQTVG